MNEDGDHLFVKYEILVDFGLLFLVGLDSQRHDMEIYWISYFNLEG